MAAYDVTYVYTDEDDWSEERTARVAAKSKAAAWDLFVSSVEGGDEDVWGKTWGSRPEHSGDDTYYVVGDPEEEDWDPPVKLIRIVGVKPAERGNGKTRERKGNGARSTRVRKPRPKIGKAKRDGKKTETKRKPGSVLAAALRRDK